MNSNEDTSHQRLDPKHINLHQHLHHHLANVAPLLADHLNISVGQAKVALSSAIDVSLLAQITHLGRAASANTTAEKDSLAVPNRKRSQVLYHSPLDTITFRRLPTVSLREFFAEKEALILTAFAKDTQLPRDKSDRLMALVATMSAQRIDSLSAYHGLNHSEKAHWLALQPLFFISKDIDKSTANPDLLSQSSQDSQTPSSDTDDSGMIYWAARLGLTPKAPELSYHDYHQQLGRKDCQLFEQSRYPVPNHAWLIRLANHINQAHSTPLNIGSTLKPTVKSANTPAGNAPNSNTSSGSALSDNQNTAARIKKAPIIAAVLSLGVVALSAFFYFNHDKKAAESAASEKPVTIPQDVAIIRVDDASDDDAQSDDNKDSKAQDSEHKAAAKAKEKSQPTDNTSASPSKDAKHSTQNK